MFEFIVASTGALSTSYVAQRVGIVRASALASLLFYLIASGFLGQTDVAHYGAIFFAGTFIGMSKATKIELVLASLVFTIFYKYVAVLLGGLGGVLGLGAFLGIFTVMALKSVVFKALALPKH